MSSSFEDESRYAQLLRGRMNTARRVVSAIVSGSMVVCVIGCTSPRTGVEPQGEPGSPPVVGAAPIGPPPGHVEPTNYVVICASTTSAQNACGEERKDTEKDGEVCIETSLVTMEQTLLVKTSHGNGSDGGERSTTINDDSIEVLCKMLMDAITASQEQTPEHVRSRPWLKTTFWPWHLRLRRV